MKETEMIKQKMTVNRLHRRNSSSSSTASIDYSSGERVEFKFSCFQAIQVPRGWDKLSLSLISVETGKTIAKTGRASARNGNCQWTETLTESIWVPHDDAPKELDQCLYKLLISMGSGRSGLLGDVTVNLLGHLSSDTSLSIAQPLKNCSYGTILQVEIQCLTPRANLRNDRWRDTDSFTEDTNVSDDLDNTSDLSDGSRITKSVGSSTGSNFLDTSQAGRSHRSYGSMDDSFSRESSSPRSNSNLSELTNDLIATNSAPHSSYHVSYSPRSSQRQDSGKVSNFIPASPLRASGPSEFELESEGATVEELKAEARTWERNARKLMVGLDFSKKESRDQTKNWENATMEILALKQEINHLKDLLDESEVKEKADDTQKLQDKDDMQAELEYEMKFQKDLNNNLSLQLSKTQESNLELVSLLQELEETLEEKTQEIELERVLKAQALSDNESEWMKKLSLKDKEILNLKERLSEVPKEIEPRSIETPDLIKEVKALKEKIQELEKDCNELTDENLELLFKLKESSKDLSTSVTSISSPIIEDSEVIKLECKIRELKEEAEKRELVRMASDELQIRCDELESKSMELEVEMKGFKDKACYLDGELDKYRAKAEDQENEIAALKQVLKLRQEEKHEIKESSKDLSTSIEDSEVIKLECKIRELKEEVVKRELDRIASNELQIHCDELERKCMELEVEMQGFKDKACDLDGKLDKYRSKAEDQENEIAALTQVLKLRQEGKHENSDHLCKDEKIQSQTHSQRDRELSDLRILKNQLTGSLKVMQTETTIISECLDKVKTDMAALNNTKEAQITSNKILEKKLLDLESSNNELELHLTELEQENLHLSKRISGLEPQLRYLTDERESSRLETQHLETRVLDLQAEIKRLENEIETSKIDTKQKTQEMQKRWLEAQEECEYLKKANPKLQANAENLIEECALLQKSNIELRQQRLDLHNRCTALESELKESQRNLSNSTTKLEDLEDKFSKTMNEIATKEKTFDSELTSELEKLTHLLENTRSSEEKLRTTVREFDANLKYCEYERVQLAEEIVVLKDQLQKLPFLQDEVVELKNSLNVEKYEKERLEASLQMITNDYEELKEEKRLLFKKTNSMQKAVIELEDNKLSKVALEEKVMRLQGDLTAREALCAQDAELKNELGRLKRSNSSLKRKVNCLQEEKDELEEKLEQKTVLEQDELKCHTNNGDISFGSEGSGSVHEYMKVSEDAGANTIDETTDDAASRIRSLENELAEALQANDMYEAQIKSFLSEEREDHELAVDDKTIKKKEEKDASLVEAELMELQERYLHMSLKYAEVESQKEELLLKLKKSWFS